MNCITNEQLNDMISSLQQDNFFDLSSFEKVLGSYGACKQTINNIVDCLVFDFAITCDANLFFCSKEELDHIIKILNELITIDSEVISINKGVEMKKATNMEKGEILQKQQIGKIASKSKKTEERRKNNKLKKSFYDPDFDYEEYYD